MKINQVLESSTTAGSIATVASNMTPQPIKRKKSKKDKPYANSLHEGTDQDLVNKQVAHWDGVAKERKDKERAALAAKKAAYDKTPAGKQEKYWAPRQVDEDNPEAEAAFKKQVAKNNATPIGPLDEAEILENDVVIAPDKGSRQKTGLISKEKFGELAKFLAPFKAAGIYVSDRRGNSVLECTRKGIAPEVAKALNAYVKATNESAGTVAGGIAAESSYSEAGLGYNNIKAVKRAVADSTDAQIVLNGEPITLEYGEARFVNGIINQAFKDGREDDMLKIMCDPVKFNKLMQRRGNSLYGDRSAQNAQAAGARIDAGLNEGPWDPSYDEEDRIARAKEKEEWQNDGWNLGNVGTKSSAPSAPKERHKVHYSDGSSEEIIDEAGGRNKQYGYQQWNVDNDKDFYNEVNHDLADVIKRKFKGKAWFNGGAYSYLIDLSKPKLIYASDGSPVRVKGWAQGLKDYASQWAWQELIDHDPYYWDRFFRPKETIRGQGDHETAARNGYEVTEGFKEGDKVYISAHNDKGRLPAKNPAGTVTGREGKSYTVKQTSNGKVRTLGKNQITKEGAKVDRMVKHVAKSEKKLGHSKKDAENIAWATANKRGMLDNKNKKAKE